MKRREVLERVRRAVPDAYTAGEARVIAFEVAECFCGFSRAEAVADPGAEAVADERVLEEACRRIAAHVPLQYVTGRTEFYGLPFRVGEGVLIPRPETEELVQWIAADCAGIAGVRLLDIGTGSGAIAVALSRLLVAPTVDAADISPDALVFAAENAAVNGATVHFVQADATAPYDTFAGLLPRHRYDVVVSNPPYIPRSEYASMRDNVRLYEPAGALFVEDADPLLFYREIGHKAARLLDAGGRLFFEVHEDYACGVCKLLSGQGFVGVECRYDMNGKPRMVRCMKE
jgi:release factor glutamine methyltransferase